MRHEVSALILLGCGFGATFAQEPAKIDFARDVQPIFKTHCTECHGGKQQKNGFRLDRRGDALRGGTSPMIVPGSSDISRMYFRLTGDKYGTQMPPDGALEADKVKVIKAWIDQGAKWPDEAAGEAPAVPPDPKATKLMDALRAGERSTFDKLFRADPKAAKLKGPGGSTPLMYAVLYGDVDAMQQLIKAGADVNVRNEAGATALHWAADDLEMTRLLVKNGAEVDARSDDALTPLLSATRRVGSLEVARLLLEAGASPSAIAPSYRGPTTPLRHAADLNDPALLKLLMDKGAEPKGPAGLALISALNVNSPAIADQLLKSAHPKLMGDALLFLVPPRGNPDGFGNSALIKKAIAHGASVNAKDPAGRTALMLAAGSEYFSLDTIQLLIDQGCDVNAKSASGETALDFARRSGKKNVVDLLVKAGAKVGDIEKRKVPEPKPAASVHAALDRTMPLLQKTDATFTQKSGCISCHNNSLTAMTVSTARAHGFPINEAIARAQVKTAAGIIDVWRERTLQAWPVPGDSATVSYTLVGLAAENHAPDPATDAWARYLKNRQSADGRWADPSHRPPLEASDFQATATSMRALKAYGLKARRAEYDAAIQSGVRWLKSAKPITNEDRAFQILGLRWAGVAKEEIQTAASDLLKEQRTDGGWAQHADLASDAYATGEALTALHEAGALAVTDTAYQRGVKFLLATQCEDGSWYVRSRSIPFQPYFESGFPHGPDQWISVAATNWAAMALLPAAKIKSP